jgi:hypothetical protein
VTGSYAVQDSDAIHRATTKGLCESGQAVPPQPIRRFAQVQGTALVLFEVMVAGNDSMDESLQDMIDFP